MGVTMMLDWQEDAHPWRRRDPRNGMEKNAPAGQRTYSVTVTAGLQAAGDTMRQGAFELKPLRGALSFISDRRNDGTGTAEKI
jgi:hypothetical protein